MTITKFLIIFRYVPVHYRLLHRTSTQFLQTKFRNLYLNDFKKVQNNSYIQKQCGFLIEKYI